MKGEMIYLALPYNHVDKTVMEYRARMASYAAAYLINLRYKEVFSPISHGHSIKTEYFYSKIDRHDWFMGFDHAILKGCSMMIILTLKGWKESKGVTQEIEWCEKYNIPIRHLDPVKVTDSINGVIESNKQNWTKAIKFLRSREEKS